ncbi:hypothetical protein LTR28_002246 [Elasticomyces elasticus]|nr:hypothetical protein LTR28_002246 [Elasticomyces elasticus]
MAYGPRQAGKRELHDSLGPSPSRPLTLGACNSSTSVPSTAASQRTVGLPEAVLIVSISSGWPQDASLGTQLLAEVC